MSASKEEPACVMMKIRRATSSHSHTALNGHLSFTAPEQCNEPLGVVLTDPDVSGFARSCEGILGGAGIRGHTRRRGDKLGGYIPSDEKTSRVRTVFVSLG